MTTATLNADPEVIALKERLEALQRRQTELSTKIAYGEPPPPPKPRPAEDEILGLEAEIAWKQKRLAGDPGTRLYAEHFVGHDGSEFVRSEDGSLKAHTEPKATLDSRAFGGNQEAVSAVQRLMASVAGWPDDLKAAVIKTLNDGAAQFAASVEAKLKDVFLAIPPSAHAAFDAVTVDDKALAEVRLAQIAELDPAARDALFAALPIVVSALQIAGKAMLDNKQAFMRGPLLFGPVDEVTRTVEGVAASMTPSADGRRYPYWGRDVVEARVDSGVRTHEACLALYDGMRQLAEFLPAYGGFRIVPVPSAETYGTLLVPYATETNDNLGDFAEPGLSADGDKEVS